MMGIGIERNDGLHFEFLSRDFFHQSLVRGKTDEEQRFAGLVLVFGRATG
jgi:hypothetical protein